MTESNFHRLNDLLVHSCNRVLRALLPAVIERERPSKARTINELILYDRGSLELKHIVNQNAHHVFPSDSIVKIERWDLQLLCFFIKYVCKPSDGICDDIDALKKIRNRVCHTANGLTNDADYQQDRNTIKRINKNFLDIIGNASMTRRIEEEIAEIYKGTMKIPEAIVTLREWIDMDEQQRTPIKDFSDVEQEILKRLLTADKNGPVPDAEFVIVVENADNIQQQDQVSEILVNMLDTRLCSNPELGLTESQLAAIRVKLKECMRHLLESGQVVVKATHGSVIITVRSSTFVSLERLWRKLVSAEMEVIMAPLQTILRKTFSERLIIKAILPKSSFLDVTGKLVQQIQTIEQDGSFIRPGSSQTQILDIAEGREKTQAVVSFKIKPNSLKDYERLHQYSEHHLKTTFERITDVLREELNAPNLRISAGLVSKKVPVGERVHGRLEATEACGTSGTDPQPDTGQGSDSGGEEDKEAEKEKYLQKRPNVLQELIETERVYVKDIGSVVEVLGGMIFNQSDRTEIVEAGGKPETDLMIKENCNAIDGLRHSQTYMAHFLHLSFLAASGHPDISKVIRLTAHSAQVQHSLALDLMVKFASSSRHVVSSLLPMILEGIKKDMPDLIIEVFDEIKTIADQMYTEAKETVKRYEELQGEVMKMMGDIDSKHKEVKQFLEELQADKKLAEEKGKIAKEEYTRMCKEKERIWEDHSKALDKERNSDFASDIFTNIAFPSMTLLGLAATSLTGGLLIGGAGFLINRWNEGRKTEERHSHTGKIDKKLLEKEMDISKYKREQLDAVHQVERLAIAEDNSADAIGLIHAYQGLGQVYAQLIRIKEFWGELVNCINLINRNTRAAYFYRVNYDLMMNKLKDSESNWKMFVVVCDKYVRVCKYHDTESIRKMYAFISEPLDGMTKAERMKRQSDIAEQLRTRIEELGHA